MKIEAHKSFLNSLQKRILPNKTLYGKFKKRLKLFEFDRKGPLLKDHALIGKELGLRSFSVTGDIRVIYKIVDKNTIILLDIGSHNQVY